MSTIQTQQLEPGCLSDERQCVLMDAAQEISGLVDQTIAAHFPLNGLAESSLYAVRGILLRLNTLAGVMFSAGCDNDEILRGVMTQAYGKHHDFINTAAIEPDAAATASHTGEAT